jgi:formylglycine-generating enzyme required for sulfatase activity
LTTLLHPIPLPAPALRRIDATPGALALVCDALYAGNDARPMLAVSPALLVDARPVTQAELERFLIVTGQAAPPYLPPIGGILDDAPCVYVSITLAEDYVRWAGKRLPTEGEWTTAVAALGAGKLGTGAVWEWTKTRSSSGGYVVRGGRWRDQPGRPPSPEHRSFATESAPDLGFRCVMDRRG